MELEVVKIEQQTNECKAFYFASSQKINHIPGQFITFELELGGKDVTRCYSVCTSDDTDEFIGIAVKKVKGGLVSHYFNDVVKVGDKLQVQLPAGKFRYDTAKELSQDVLLLAGGSGITPMMSILKTILVKSETKRIKLVYMNTSESDIIFKKELETLQTKHPNRLEVIHYLNSKHIGDVEETKKLFGLSKTKVVNEHGYLTANNAIKIIKDLQLATDAPAYICGPAPLMVLLEEALTTAGFSKDRIRKEIFTSSISAASFEMPKAIVPNAKVTVEIEGKTYEFETVAGKSILESALQVGIKMPHSCKEGHCTSCYGTCTTGGVEMLTDEALTDEELAEGGVLSCVGYATAKKVNIKF